MPRTFPWHSANSAVYHNDGDCVSGKRIARSERREGSGGKVLCQRCAQLNRVERHASASRKRPDYSTS